MTLTVPVTTAANRYDVLVGLDVLHECSDALATFFTSYRRPDAGMPRRVPVVADRTVQSLHGDRLARALGRQGLECAWHVVEAGEHTKSWAELQRLTDWLIGLEIGRADHVIALGGGVVGDLTGFACAILKRGCGFVQVPTTLLAQVDSSVGGKTGINTAAGKNLVGAFHQPALVVADTALLATLPAREMRAGYAEVLKYGLLGDAAFFGWLEAHGPQVLAGHEPFLTQAVARCVAAKAAIVAEDERETTGRRALLNLGHTFGHALEAETGYSSRLLHGEAVALGCVLAARYSARRGELAMTEAERIEAAVRAAGLPTRLKDIAPDVSGRELVQHMRHDKKAVGSTLPFVLLRSIGDAWLAKDVELRDVEAFLDEQLAR